MRALLKFWNRFMIAITCVVEMYVYVSCRFLFFFLFFLWGENFVHFTIFFGCKVVLGSCMYIVGTIIICMLYNFDL
jgi:hypothetical protein